MQVNVFLGLLPIEWLILDLCRFRTAHHGPAAKRDKMMSGAKDGRCPVVSPVTRLCVPLNFARPFLARNPPTRAKVAHNAFHGCAIKCPCHSVVREKSGIM